MLRALLAIVPQIRSSAVGSRALAETVFDEFDYQCEVCDRGQRQERIWCRMMLMASGRRFEASG